MPSNGEASVDLFRPLRNIRKGIPSAVEGLPAPKAYATILSVAPETKECHMSSHDEPLEPFPKLDYDKSWRYPPGPGDPTWEALHWLERNVLNKGRPLTEEDLELLSKPLAETLKP